MPTSTCTPHAVAGSPGSGGSLALPQHAITPLTAPACLPCSSMLKPASAPLATAWSASAAANLAAAHATASPPNADAVAAPAPVPAPAQAQPVQRTLRSQKIPSSPPPPCTAVSLRLGGSRSGGVDAGALSPAPASHQRALPASPLALAGRQAAWPPGPAQPAHGLLALASEAAHGTLPAHSQRMLPLLELNRGIQAINTLLADRWVTGWLVCVAGRAGLATRVWQAELRAP